jgi:ribosomal-protein-alanine N-acetyltransferase
MPFPCLKTPRLFLRELVTADASALFDLHADREHMRWYGIDPFPDPAAAENRIKQFSEMRMAPNPATPWAIELATGGFIGTCGLFAWNRNWRKCSVGCELTSAAQGHGYMHEALHAIISWGFREMSLNRVEAQVHPRNKRSIVLLNRLGFTEEGRLRQAAYWSNEYHDMLQFSVLNSEWKI